MRYMVGASRQDCPARKVCRSEHVGPLVLSEIVYGPDCRIGWHSHQLAGFALTIRGSSVESFANAEFDQTERGVLLRPAQERHWDLIGQSGATCFLIEVGRSWLAELPRVDSILQRPSFHRGGTVLCLAQRAYREWLVADSASGLAIRALLLEMAVCLMREEEKFRCPGPPAWLERVKRRLDEGFSETPTLEELAAIGGVHPTHVARHFRRYYHSTVGEHLRRRRVEAASILLARKDRSLTDIALEAGFSSHAHFSTVFKRFTGMTPSQFRDAKR